MAATRQDPDSITRDQFTIFDVLCTEIAISDEERRRVLLLSPEEWSQWRRVREGGPVPAVPERPAMLMRMGQAAHRLTVTAESGRAAATPTLRTYQV